MIPKAKNPAAVALGRLGGAAGKGKAKARTPEQARAAAKARWAKVVAEQTKLAAALWPFDASTLHGSPKAKAENRGLTSG